MIPTRAFTSSKRSLPVSKSEPYIGGEGPQAPILRASKVSEHPGLKDSVSSRGRRAGLLPLRSGARRIQASSHIPDAGLSVGLSLSILLKEQGLDIPNT